MQAEDKTVVAVLSDRTSRTSRVGLPSRSAIKSIRKKANESGGRYEVLNIPFFKKNGYYCLNIRENGNDRQGILPLFEKK